jgi:hypothetical protein
MQIRAPCLALSSATLLAPSLFQVLKLTYSSPADRGLQHLMFKIKAHMINVSGMTAQAVRFQQRH